MSKSIRYTEEFKRATVVQVTDRGHSVRDGLNNLKDCEENTSTRLISINDTMEQIANNGFSESLDKLGSIDRELNTIQNIIFEISQKKFER